MKYFPLSPPPGINTDDTTFTQEGRWADCNNVRFWRGRPQVIGGWTSFTNAMTGITRGLYGFIDTNGGVTPRIIAGNTNKLYAIGTAGTLTDITPVGLAGGGVGWTFGAFGTTLLASPSSAASQGIFQWTGSGAATLISVAPTTIVGGICVTAERQVLAFGCNEEVSGTLNRRCIRGSDLEDATSATAWTSLSTNNAFEHILDDPGVIVGARLVGQYVAVWTTSSLWIGEYLGNPDQTYRFTRVGYGCGLYGLRCAAVVESRVYWMSPSFQWYSWSPGEIPGPISCPISLDFKSNIDTTVGGSFTFAVFNSVFREVWLFYPDTRDATGECSRYVAFSIDDGTWFKGILARTAAVDTVGIVQSTGTATPPRTMFMANPSDLKVYYHENVNTATTVAKDWSLQSSDYYVGESATRMMIRGVVTDFKDQSGDLSLTLFVRDRPQSTAVTKGPYTLTAGATKKDFRASGKIIAIKLSATASQTYARLGKLEFDTVPTGER